MADNNIDEHYKIYNSYSQIAKRMAFYSGIWKKSRFTISLNDAIFYGESIPKIISIEHRRIEKGYKIRILDLKTVKELILEYEKENILKENNENLN
jgi:hypothetical protein